MYTFVIEEVSDLGISQVAKMGRFVAAFQMWGVLGYVSHSTFVAVLSKLRLRCCGANCEPPLNMHARQEFDLEIKKHKVGN